MNENKNHQAIIKAIKDIPDVKYVIVGKRVLENKLKVISEELGVSDRVFLTGFRTDVRDLLWAADCFAFPSIREGLGIAALEGMASGLPVIGHDIGGIRDFVIEETGWLCNEEIDYVQAIVKSIDSRIKSKACLKMAMCFDQEKTNAIMRDVYKKYE